LSQREERAPINGAPSIPKGERRRKENDKGDKKNPHP